MSFAAVLHHSRRQLSHPSTAEATSTTTTTTDATSSSSSNHLLHWHYTEFDDKNFQIHGQTLFYLFILFSIILLVTLLLLYARWFFRFRHLRHHPPSSAAATHHLYNSHAPPCAAARGLSPAAINAIPIILHQEEEEGAVPVDTECCICLGVFEDGDKVKVLPTCRHRFHSDCVDRWLCAQSSCPLCRVSLQVVEPKPESVLDDVV